MTPHANSKLRFRCLATLALGAAAALALPLTPSAAAESHTVTGITVDPFGLPLPNVTVSLTSSNEQTGTFASKAAVKSGADGSFSLATGTDTYYKLMAEAIDPNGTSWGEGHSVIMPNNSDRNGGRRVVLAVMLESPQAPEPSAPGSVSRTEAHVGETLTATAPVFSEGYACPAPEWQSGESVGTVRYIKAWDFTLPDAAAGERVYAYFMCGLAVTGERSGRAGQAAVFQVGWATDRVSVTQAPVAADIGAPDGDAAKNDKSGGTKSGNKSGNKSGSKSGNSKSGSKSADTKSGNKSSGDSDGAGSAKKSGKKIAKAAKPTLKGKAKVGKKLKVVIGSWAKGVKKTVRWYANGKLIKGAKGKTLKLKGKFKGMRITVRVTGQKAGYQTVTKRSAAKTVR
jgi:hypothetical protein